MPFSFFLSRLHSSVPTALTGVHYPILNLKAQYACYICYRDCFELVRYSLMSYLQSSLVVQVIPANEQVLDCK